MPVEKVPDLPEGQSGRQEEGKTPPLLCIGMVLKDDTFVHTDILLSALRLERPGWKTNLSFRGGSIAIEQARNEICMDFLKSGAEWLFMWDSDLAIPPNTITRLLLHAQPIVSGLYFRRHRPVFLEAFRYVKDADMLKPLDIKELQGQADIMPVDAVGAGCLLINRTVMEGMIKVVHKKEIIWGTPNERTEYYEFFRNTIINPQDGKPGFSEDIQFCLYAQQAGFKVFLDPFVSCGHLTTMMLKDNQVQWSMMEGNLI